jgi:hypothetical protein
LMITDCFFKIRRVTQVLKFISYTRPVYFVGLKALVSFFIWDHFRVCDYNQIFVIVIPQLIHLSVNLIIIVLTSQINKRHNYFLPLTLKIIFETYTYRSTLTPKLQFSSQISKLEKNNTGSRFFLTCTCYVSRSDKIRSVVQIRLKFEKIKN